MSGRKANPQLHTNFELRWKTMRVKVCSNLESLLIDAGELDHLGTSMEFMELCALTKKFIKKNCTKRDLHIYQLDGSIAQYLRCSLVSLKYLHYSLIRCVICHDDNPEVQQMFESCLSELPAVHDIIRSRTQQALHRNTLDRSAAMATFADKVGTLSSNPVHLMTNMKSNSTVPMIYSCKVALVSDPTKGGRAPRLIKTKAYNDGILTTSVKSDMIPTRAYKKITLDTSVTMSARPAGATANPAGATANPGPCRITVPLTLRPGTLAIAPRPIPAPTPVAGPAPIQVRDVSRIRAPARQDCDVIPSKIQKQ